MKLLSILIVVLTLGGQICFADNTVLPCRYSTDFRIFFIYLTTNIAITKTTRTDADDIDRTDFAIGRAHWAGEPELANATGDRADEDIAPTPKRAGMDRDGKWLLVSGQDFDVAKLTSHNRVWAISLSSEKVYSAIDMASLESKLKTNHITLPPIDTEPVQVFFDRMLISHLSQKKFSLSNPAHQATHISEAISSDGKATPTDVRQKPAITNSF